jgi:hypothetical protein
MHEFENNFKKLPWFFGMHPMTSVRDVLKLSIRKYFPYNFMIRGSDMENETD